MTPTLKRSSHRGAQGDSRAATCGRLRHALWLPLLLLAACGGGTRVKGGGFATPPQSAKGFPYSHLEGDVAIESSFNGKYKDAFGWNMLSKGVLPLQFKIGLRRTKDESLLIRMDPRDTGMRLYLADGTVLDVLSADEVAARTSSSKVKQRIETQALGVSLLSDWDESQPPAYVFFDLAGLKSPKLNGSQLSYLKGKDPVAVDLTNALLSFNLVVDNRTHPHYVGVGY